MGNLRVLPLGLALLKERVDAFLLVEGDAGDLVDVDEAQDALEFGTCDEAHALKDIDGSMARVRELERILARDRERGSTRLPLK